MSATPLPPATDFTGAEVTEGEFKTAISSLRAYLAFLLGTTGEKADAQTALGIEDAIPTGGIIMWSGAISAIPAGWALCDGNNSTPDLRGRFIIAADADSGGSYNVDATGNGSVPSHNHSGTSLSTNNTGAHTHDILMDSLSGTVPGLQSTSSARAQVISFDVANVNAESNGNHSHSISGNTGNRGTGSDNIAKYYALAYIMKT